MDRLTLGLILFLVIVFLVRNFSREIDDIIDKVISLCVPFIMISLVVGCSWYFWPGKEIGEYIAAAVGLIAIPAIVYAVRQYNALNREIERSKKGA